MTVDNIFETKYDKLTVVNNKTQNSVRFIHASDIHLGAGQYRNDHRSNDFIQAFQEILELAIIHQVDFIILVGDVFT